MPPGAVRSEWELFFAVVMTLSSDLDACLLSRWDWEKDRNLE